MNLLILNGIYDIISAISILFFCNMSNLHLDMFKNKQEMIIRRLLAYWIFTYGIIRLYTGVYNDYKLGSITYLIEAFCFEYESINNENLIKYKVRFVSVLSLIVFLYLRADLLL